MLKQLDPQQAQLLKAWRIAKAEVKRAEELLGAIDAMVREQMTDSAEYVDTETGQVLLKVTSYTQDRMNTRRFKEDFPDVAAEYSTTITVTRYSAP